MFIPHPTGDIASMWRPSLNLWKKLFHSITLIFFEMCSLVYFEILFIIFGRFKTTRHLQEQLFVLPCINEEKSTLNEFESGDLVCFTIFIPFKMFQ